MKSKEKTIVGYQLQMMDDLNPLAVKGLFNDALKAIHDKSPKATFRKVEAEGTLIRFIFDAPE